MPSENTASLLKLFARGRYVTPRSLALNEKLSDNPEYKHAERERFAVAAIAFVCRHDDDFRDRFLRVVANLKSADIEKIEVEPEQWGDLILEGGKNVVILEFKLRAALGGHQDPNSKGRLFAEGYGARILKKYGSTGKRLRYVIVGKDLVSGTRQGLEYHAVPWRQFLHRRSKETDLERDLFDCLGRLGAPLFLSRHMTNKAPTKEAIGALDVYGLLQLAAGSMPTGDPDSGPDHIGLELSSSGATPTSQHKFIKDIVDPPKRSLGWIGYERREEFKEQLCLSVWLYCSARGKNRVHKRLTDLGAKMPGMVVFGRKVRGFHLS